MVMIVVIRTATVLVVDDSMSSRELACAVMGYAGYRTLRARDAAAALNLLRSNAVDLVLADIRLPDMNGYDLARVIRADPAQRTLPVVFYTAYYDVTESRQRARSVGVTHVVPKDGELRTLADSVHDALRPAC
jgi:CheY-like chemotaxis protein